MDPKEIIKRSSKQYQDEEGSSWDNNPLLSEMATAAIGWVFRGIFHVLVAIFRFFWH